MHANPAFFVLAPVGNKPRSSTNTECEGNRFLM